MPSSADIENQPTRANRIERAGRKATGLRLRKGDGSRVAEAGSTSPRRAYRIFGRRQFVKSWRKNHAKKGEYMLRKASIIAFVITLLGAVFLSTGAQAAPKGNSWIELNSSGASASVQPSLGSSVSFLTSYPVNVKNPRIEVLCYQNGTLVYGEAGSVDHVFLLGGAGSIWLSTGGSANCIANLFYFGWKAGTQTYNLLAWTSFVAGG